MFADCDVVNDINTWLSWLAFCLDTPAAEGPGARDTAQEGTLVARRVQLLLFLRDEDSEWRTTLAMGTGVTL